VNVIERRRLAAKLGEHLGDLAAVVCGMNHRLEDELPEELGELAARGVRVPDRLDQAGRRQAVDEGGASGAVLGPALAQVGQAPGRREVELAGLAPPTAEPDHLGGQDVAEDVRDRAVARTAGFFERVGREPSASSSSRSIAQSWWA
jgi:hypothetical protein